MRERTLSHLRLVPYAPFTSGGNSSRNHGCDDDSADPEMYRLGLAWVAWRLRTGQINALTAREQRYTVSDFTRAMGNRRPNQIGTADLERWRASMTGRLAAGTIRQRWGVTKQFLEWLEDEGKLRRNPARRLPKPKVPRTVHRNLRPDQATALHDACIDERERLIVALGFQLGMRRAEIANAEIGWFDFVAKVVTITGKGGHQRNVALTQGAQQAITAYLATTPAHAGPLLRRLDGTTGITPGYVGAIFTRIAYRAGVKSRGWDGVGSHSARHTAGSDVAHRTGNAVIVRDFLGHANLATTDIYVGAADIEEQREAIEGRRYAS